MPVHNDRRHEPTMQETSQEFSQWVMDYLTKHLEWTQRRIAAVVGADESQISHIRHGRSAFTFNNLIKIAREAELPLPNFLADAVRLCAPEVWKRRMGGEIGATTERILASRLRVHKQYLRMRECNQRADQLADQLREKSPELARLCEEMVTSMESGLELVEKLAGKFLEKLGPSTLDSRRAR